jgi:hypothetical protein
MRLGALTSAVVVVILATSTVRAEEPVRQLSKVPETIEIRIGAVIASNTGTEFDPRLVAFRHQFNALFPYTSYHLLKEERQRVAWGGRAGFDIPGGRYVVVLPKEYKNERVSMQVMVIEGTRPIVDTVLSLRNHATLLVGGPRQHDGVLILSIGADASR